MTRDDLRAQRFAGTWWGPSLATLLGIGSTVELAAMPLPATDDGSTLILQSFGPEEEAQRPAEPPPAPPADESTPDFFIELNEALTAAHKHLQELSKGAEAIAATRQLQEELAALRQENQKLRTGIEAVHAERDELETAKRASEAHTAELTKTPAQATAQAREMDEKLVAVAVRWRNAQRNSSLIQARTSGDQIEVEVGPTQSAQHGPIDELDDGAEQTSIETARVRQKIEAGDQYVAAADKARAEAEARLSEMRDSLHRAELEKARISVDLANVKRELVTAQKQVAQIYHQAAALANERDELRTRLAAADAGLGQSQAAKVQPANEVAELRGATGTATDVVPPNVTTSATQPGAGEAAHLDQRGVLGGVPAVLTLADLPREKRLRVQGLVADLHSKLDERGLMTTLPGELLFAVGRNEVQADAYATLVKIAELIRLYDNRQVLIVGHTDANGNDAYNQELSERRAELVKQILVENFDLTADRLSTEGVGETRPIASNATPEGRAANRRVEVLILN
jgi:outer membrane protein OmpA-like peptidoglycan-associated protein